MPSTSVHDLFLTNAHRELVFNRRVKQLVKNINSLLPENCRTLLDVGSGSGDIAHHLSQVRTDLEISGVDVLVRPKTAIPTKSFDGLHIPEPDKSYDVVMLIDVLHHTLDAAALLKECARVATQGVIVKDHLQNGHWDRFTLRFMDWVANAGYGVHLQYSYFSEDAWQATCLKAALKEQRRISHIGLYPFPASLLFERKLHFVSYLR